MTNSFRYFMPTEIFYGTGSLNKLSTAKLPGKKALIVYGGSSMKRLGYVDRVISLLKENGVESALYDKILPNPVVEHVMEGAQVAKDEACDFVIGLGGGSSMDSAKAIAIMAINPGDFWDYIAAGSGKGKPIEKALPIVCITTTAGTGTEADPWLVVTKTETQEKIGIGCDATYPALSIVDPELMVSVPAHLTAFQGFDALFHSMEGYLANIANPMSDMFALKSIEYAAKYLPTAVKEPENLEARGGVALANTLGGFVESTSCVVSQHAIEHAMSAIHPELPHGAGLIILSLEFFRHFAPLVPDRAADMAKAMGGEASPEGLISALEQLQKDCGVYNLKMSDYGFTIDEMPKVTENARYTMGGIFTLDRVLLSDDEITGILTRSFR